jgi:hypothetical protein
MINRPPPKKLLIVLSFWDGDHEQMGTLCRLLADLEPVKNQYADILLYRRSDASEMDADIRSALLVKFSKVHSTKCRRLNARGYPLGSNEMFYDLIELLRSPTWATNYYAFYNMEADCVPLATNWIQQLGDEFKRTHEEFDAIGHFCEKPIPHLNGASVYAMDFLNKAGGFDLLGGPSNTAYDFHHAKRILPLARDTSLMMLDFNRKTITAEDLFGIRKNGAKPVLFHGVKDQSALIAVRSRLVDGHAETRDLSKSTIFTYFEPNPAFDEAEERACLALWKDAWSAAGWNTIIHERRDAQKNPRYQEVVDKITKQTGFQWKGNHIMLYLRWLALGYAGGGLHSDYDVLPRSDFHPDSIVPRGELSIFQVVKKSSVFSLFYSTRASANKILDGIEPAGSQFHEEYHNISGVVLQPIVKSIGERGWPKAKCVHFSPSACAKFEAGGTRSRLMANYLEGKVEIKI